MKKTKDHYYVYNTLLRIEGKVGHLREPFEKPSPRHDLWVLELTLPKRESVKKWQKRVMAVLHKEMSLLRKYAYKAAKITLFLETAGLTQEYPVFFEGNFLKTLSKFNCSLEYRFNSSRKN